MRAVLGILKCLTICFLVTLCAFTKESGATEAGIRLAQAAQKPESCPQVISCGTKNGMRKEYPTPCAAKDDGATDISPKTGSSCSVSK